MVGADKIIGVDINPNRIELAKKFARTHLINPKDVREPGRSHRATDRRRRWTGRSNASARRTLMRQALECTHKAGRKSFIIGVAAAGEEITHASVPAGDGPRAEGLSIRRREAARTCRRSSTWYMEGKINIDDLITHRLPLERINEGFDLMKKGESIRSVVLTNTAHIWSA